MTRRFDGAHVLFGMGSNCSIGGAEDAEPTPFLDILGTRHYVERDEGGRLLLAWLQRRRLLVANNVFNDKKQMYTHEHYLTKNKTQKDLILVKQASPMSRSMRSCWPSEYYATVSDHCPVEKET